MRGAWKGKEKGTGRIGKKREMEKGAEGTKQREK